MSYQVEFTPRARIMKALARPASDPYKSPNVKALEGGGYRLQVGDFRVLYIVENARLVVVVVGVRDRKEAYR